MFYRAGFKFTKSASECAADGFLHVYNMGSSAFVNACKVINIPENEMIEEDELRLQYRLFLKAIDSEGPHLLKKQTLIFLHIFFFSKNKIFDGCEYVIHMLVSAAITKSVESVVESWGSSLELASSKTRNTSQERLQDELQVIVNGPDVSCSQPIIQEALARLKCVSKTGNLLLFLESPQSTKLQKDF